MIFTADGQRYKIGKRGRLFRQLDDGAWIYAYVLPSSSNPSISQE